MTIFKGLNSNSDLDYPTINPTLDLNFAASKTLDPRITYSRNSIGTYVGSDGYIKTAVANEPRFEHDPVTGKCLGFLIEESRINRIANSSLPPTSPFGTSNTIGSNCLTATNTAIAPDGTLTAYTVNPSAPYSYVGIDPNVFSVVSGQTYTASIWLKKIPGVTYRNLSMVTDGWTSPDVLSFVSALNASTDWIRISFSFTSNVTANRGIWLIRQQSGDTVSSQPLYVWGPQIEVGSFPTSYIPTTTTTVTRAADNAIITGTNFSSWYNLTKGTFVAVAKPINLDIFTSGGIFGCIDANGVSIAQGLRLIGTTTQFRATNFFDKDGSSNDRFFSNVLSGLNKCCIAGDINDTTTGVAFNGSLVTGGNGTQTGYVNVKGIEIGKNFGLGFSGIINRITYYPQRLPDSQLQLLTQN